MGLRSWIAERREERQNISIGFLDRLIETAGRIFPSSAGVQVTHATAQRLTAVWACQRIIGNTIAAMPAHVFERLGEGSVGRRHARTHPLERVLTIEANPLQSPFDFWSMVQPWVDGFGNGLAEMIFDRRGDVVRLWPIHPNRVRKILRTPQGLVYEFHRATGTDKVTNPNTPPTLPGSSVLHIKQWPLEGGLWGRSTIEAGTNAIGIGLAADDYTGRFFQNDATPGGIMQVPGKMQKKDITAFTEMWRGLHSRARKHSIGVLTGGMEYKQIGIKGRDAQLLESRKFTPLEISRLFGVQPFKIGVTDAAPRANAEQQNLDYQQDTILPRVINIEQALRRVAIRRAEQATVFVSFNLDGIVRADLKSRNESYAIGRQWGWWSADDVRAKENENPLPDGQGETYMVPLNMVSATDLSDPPEPPPAPVPPPPPDGGDDDDESEEEEEGRAEIRATGKQKARQRLRIRRRHIPAFQKALVRIGELQAREVEKILKRTFPELPDARSETRANQNAIDEIEALFDDELPDDIRKEIAPTMDALVAALAVALAAELGEAIGDEAVDAFVAAEATVFAASNTEIAKRQILSILQSGASPDEMAALLRTQLTAWTDKIPSTVAQKLATRTDNVFSPMQARAAGRQTGVWVTNDPCPLCNDLDGMTVNLQSRQSFFNKGDQINPTNPDGTPDETVTPLVVDRRIPNPPLHQGCECSMSFN